MAVLETVIQKQANNDTLPVWGHKDQFTLMEKHYVIHNPVRGKKGTMRHSFGLLGNIGLDKSKRASPCNKMQISTRCSTLSARPFWRISADNKQL